MQHCFPQMRQGPGYLSQLEDFALYHCTASTVLHRDVAKFTGITAQGLLILVVLSLVCIPTSALGRLPQKLSSSYCADQAPTLCLPEIIYNRK
jgi:hypothetical protein